MDPIFDLRDAIICSSPIEGHPDFSVAFLQVQKSGLRAGTQKRAVPAGQPFLVPASLEVERSGV
jgi:hypothetical protein